MRQKARRDRKSNTFAWWICLSLIFLSCVGITIGIVIGLRQSNTTTTNTTTTTATTTAFVMATTTPVATTTAPVTTTTTPVATTTPSSTCPLENPTCNATYSFPIDVDSTQSSIGNFVSYSACNDTLVYFRNDAKLIAQWKGNGTIIWQVSLCTNSEAYLSGRSLYITIDGDVYFLYQCYYDGGLMLERYSLANGTLIWSLEISNYNAIFTAPIVTDIPNNRVYVVRLEGNYMIPSAHNAADGTQLWQTFIGANYFNELIAITYDPVGEWLFLGDHRIGDPAFDCTVYQLEVAGGSIYDTYTGYKNIESFTTDRLGYLYVRGIDVNNATYVVKLDNSLTQVWSSTITTPNQTFVDFKGYTTILYDPLSTLLILGGSLFNGTATDPFPWFATMYSTNGTLASMTQLPMISQPTVYVSLSPSFETQGVIYGLYTDDAGSENTTIATFCY